MAWGNALGSCTILAAASAGDQIWVAAELYGADTSMFELKDGDGDLWGFLQGK